jgi:hypothetical protein
MPHLIPFINKYVEAFDNPRIFLTNRGSVMDNIKPYFFTTELKKAKVAVLFQDVVGQGLLYAKEAKERHIPIVLVQHGKGAVVDYVPPIKHSLLADKICVWGPRDRDILINGGIDKTKIVLTGCPLFDGLVQKRDTHSGFNALFAPGHSHEIDENKLVMEALNERDDINVHAKLLSVHNKEMYGKNAIISNSFDDDHMKKILKAVRRADVLISTSSGTIEAIAMYFGIPVIFLDISTQNEKMKEHPMQRKSKEKHFGTYYIEHVGQLNDAIDKIKAKPSMLNKEMEEELMACAGVGMKLQTTRLIIDTIKDMAK